MKRPQQPGTSPECDRASMFIALELHLEDVAFIKELLEECAVLSKKQLSNANVVEPSCRGAIGSRIQCFAWRQMESTRILKYINNQMKLGNEHRGMS